MATAQMGAHLARLTASGLEPATPAAAIQWGTTAAQKTVVATLGTLADEAERQGLKAPAVIVVGECAALGRELNWFEAMPLFGRRIVITRPTAERLKAYETQTTPVLQYFRAAGFPCWEIEGNSMGGPPAIARRIQELVSEKLGGAAGIRA